MTTQYQYAEVRTKNGSRIHKARIDMNVTLCGFVVFYRREGGSWAPEHTRRWDHGDSCHRCDKASGTGP